jgi:general stress protein 26
LKGVPVSKDVLKSAIQQAKKSIKQGMSKLNKEEVIKESLELIEKSKICMLGTNGGDGFPYIKAMLNLKNEGLKKIWFSTNTSSKRVQRLKQDNRASVYYVDENSYQGLLLIGTIEILQDIASRKMLWSEGAEIYYPKGVADPDYTVLCFTAKKANYYHGLTNLTFEIE